MAAQLAVRHQLRPAAKVHDQRKIQAIAQEDGGRSALGKMSVNQLRSYSPRAGMELRSYSHPAVKLAAAATESSSMFREQDGILRQREIVVCWDESHVLRCVAPQLIHLERNKGTGHGEESLCENQHFGRGSPDQAPS